MKSLTELSPEIGRQALVAILREGSILAALRVMYQRLGRLFRIPMPGFRPFVAGGPDSVRKVFITNQNKLRWRLPGDPVTKLLRRGVLVVDGEEHDFLRKLMEPSLQSGNLSGYARMMVQQVDRVTNTWREGETRDMLVESRRIALLIVMQGLFGVDFWEDMPRLWKPILKAIEYISPGFWILSPRLPRLGFNHSLRQVDDYLFGIIRDRRAKPGLPDLLNHLIEAGLDDDLIRDQMLTMLIAGHDTSTALLAWTFYLLGSHPDIYERLQSDLHEALQGKLPSSETSGWQPPLLDQVIKETLRLYPPIHVGNRLVAEELELEGCLVPAGERLMVSIYLTHRDGESWEDPDVFSPQRFERGRRQPPDAYLPFGRGPRACIGAAFGLVEARLVLARLLQTFHFELTGSNVRAHMGATLEPRPGVFMRVHRIFP